MSTIEKGYKIPSHFGTNYVVVEGNRTPLQNAQELDAAMTKAYAMTNGGTIKSIVLIYPGYYLYPENSYFSINYQNVDVSSITGEPDVFIGVDTTTQTNATAIFLGSYAWYVTVTGLVADKNFIFQCDARNYSTKVINCKGGTNSFTTLDANSCNYTTFINCIGGDNSFGGGGRGTVTNYGDFINCSGGSYSFINSYSDVTNYGKFENCVGGDYSFCSSVYSVAWDYGEYYNCKGGANSFAYPFNNANTPVLQMINCIGDGVSFQPNGVFTGYAYFCYLTGANTFGARTHGLNGCIYCSVDYSGEYTSCGSYYYY